MWPFEPVPDSASSAVSAGDAVPAGLARAIAGLGRSLIATGLVLLAFAAFQLWGTGIAQARAQEQLAAELEGVLASRGGSGPVPSALSIDKTRTNPVLRRAKPTIVEQPTPQVLTVPQAPPAPEPLAVSQQLPPPELGDALGRLIIPAIDVDKTIVQGTSRDVLRSGPGHYAATPLPGQAGNAAIAGHRTTHGAPFFDIDQLEPGDEITVETVDGIFSYLVEAQDNGDGGQSGHRIVDPDEVSVIGDQGDDRLTLTACHPKYSAKQRIIVTATLVPQPEPLPELAQEPEQELVQATRAAPHSIRTATHGQSGSQIAAPQAFNDSLQESLGWQRQYAPATFGWAGFTAAIAAAAQILGRLWRRAPVYAMAVPPFGLSLYYCFVNLEHFIPAV